MAPSILLHDSHAFDRQPFVFERFLTDSDRIWQQISLEYRLDVLIRQMLLSAAAALAGYGLVMGLGHGWQQAIASAIKLPLLFLLTLTICLPTLYLFNLLGGGRLTVQQTFALVLAAITVSATLLLPFVPIVLFFLVTAPDYHFFILLNVVLLALTGSIGLSFLLHGARRLNTFGQADHESPTERTRTVNLTLLQLWMGLYGLVGSQLGWTLRPFFGDPVLPFQLFHAIEGNFGSGVLDALINTLR